MGHTDDLPDAVHAHNRRTNRYVCTCSPHRPPTEPWGECTRCRKLRTDQLACYWHAQRRTVTIPATVLIDGIAFCDDCHHRLTDHPGRVIHLTQAAA